MPEVPETGLVSHLLMMGMGLVAAGLAILKRDERKDKQN